MNVQEEPNMRDSTTINPVASNVRKNPAHLKRKDSGDHVPSPYKEPIEQVLEGRASDYTSNPLRRSRSRDSDSSGTLSANGSPTKGPAIAASAQNLSFSKPKAAAANDDLEQQPPLESGFSLHVLDLSFTPNRAPLLIYLEFIRQRLALLGVSWLMPFYRGVTRKQQLSGYELGNVSFKARGGELVALMGDDGDRFEVVQLLTGRKKSGRFDGQISLTGDAIPRNSYYYNHIAFVKDTPLFIPGLTYYDMVKYAARLRMDAYPEVIDAHVEEVLRVMKLSHIKHRKIPEYPVTRGEVGSEFRRLGIAIEIVHAPKVIVIDEPTLDFDPAISLKLMECLKDLTRSNSGGAGGVQDGGHLVICSMRKPSHAEFAMLDRVVLLSEGYTVFNSKPEHVKEYFCGSSGSDAAGSGKRRQQQQQQQSPSLGYELRPGVEIVDFLLDIASGVERPRGERAALLPAIMMEKFEASDYCDQPRFFESTHISAFAPEFFAYYGMLRGFKFQSLSAMWRHALVVFERAVVTKLKDVESIKTGIGGIILVAVLAGYLQYGQGHYGRYTSTFFGVGYASTYNTTGLIFFNTCFLLAFPFKDTHIFCQKLALFRYERDSGYCAQFPFLVASVISEVPFYLLLYFIFGNIVFFMLKMGKGPDKWLFYMGTVLMGGMIGLSLAFMMAALLRKELVVRDWFLVLVITIVMLSGFTIQHQYQRSYMQDLTNINPGRWIFEALVEWKFSWYEDGDTFLSSYDFTAFDHSKIGEICLNFILVINCITYFILFPVPILLSRVPQHKRRRDSRAASRSSIDSVGDLVDVVSAANAPPRRSTRTSEQPVQPMLFMRESTVTGRASKLSVSLSQTGEADNKHGPTVMFKDLTYRVRDPKSPVGYKTILDNVSGQFDWGKLSMIMGAPESGKSSLIHILAGDVAMASDVQGTVLLNGRPPNQRLKPFEGCGFVPMETPLLRDLNVLEVITFAMKLRCYNRSGLRVVAENVKNTMELLQLNDIPHKKVSSLTPGEYKRLSIAEEMVHGPKLLYMDEPTTGVSLMEVSVLLLTFREMVNADRTVVATIHQPTADTFKLFDTMMLLSVGRVLYFGKPEDAVNFFVQSPHQYNSVQYKNPAEFLADISAGHLADRGGDIVDSSLLNEYYRSTEDYNRMRQRLKEKESDKDEDSLSPYAARSSAARNPLTSPNTPHAPAASTATATAATAVTRKGSFEVEGVPDHQKIVSAIKKPPPMLALALQSLLHDVLLHLPTLEELSHFTFKRRILLHRSVLALCKNHTLFVSSMVANVCLCAWFVWVVRTPAVSAVLALYSIGAMFLIFTNVQFVSFIFIGNQVFLKEHGRGLYSTFAHFTVNSWPLYALRVLNAIIYASFFVKGLVLDDAEGKFGFNYLLFITYFTVTTAMCESLVYMSSNVRDNYSTISAIAVLNFFFSGLFVKSQSLPRWLAPWMPSLSPVRWIAQASFLNLYKGDTDTFPFIPGTNYSNYKGFKNLFGWGGKTKWYCLGMLAIFFIFFRLTGLLGMGYRAFTAPGNRQKRHRMA